MSKSHCRIYLDGDAWFLEDLGSANGTYLGEDKLAAPTELMPNDVISMSKTRFEVLGPIGDEDGGGDDDAPPPTPPPAPKAKAPPPKPAVSATAKKPGGKPASAGPAMSAARKSTGTAEAGMGDAGSADAANEAKGVGYFLIAVPKAIAFYLAAVPLMALNPIGTIRKGIETQKHEAKGRMELIAYALPSLLFTGLVSWVCQVIVAIRYGTLNIGAIIPIGPIIGGVVGAVVVGFIWHPVMNWIITKAKGESDERSRTNYFMMVMTGAMVAAIPAALGLLLAMVPFRLILILPPVLGFVGTLISLFISYSWLNYFNVVKWLPKVVLGFAALSAVFTVLGVLSALTSTPAGGSVGGSGGDAAAQIQAATDKALADAKDATDKANEAIADAKEGAKDAKEAAKDAKEAAKDAKDAKKPPKEKEAAAEKPPKEAVVAAPPPGEEKANPPTEKTTVAAVSGGGYGAYAQMRDSVEKRINDDPTLLKRTSGLLEMYRAYEAEAFEIESRYQKDTSKKPADAKLNNHLRDAELYEKTEKKVKELYGKLK